MTSTFSDGHVSTPVTLSPKYYWSSFNPANLFQAQPYLFHEHRDELATNKELMVLNPDLQTYQDLYEADCLLSIGIFEENTDRLIGYSINFLTNNLHYSHLAVCQNDILYLDPEFRKGVMGIKLIRETERRAKAIGADLMLWHAKAETPLNDILPRMDYGVQDIVYSKAL